jgi:GTP-binding protein HflX
MADSGAKPERALLVGVEFGLRHRGSRAGVEGARRAIARSEIEEVTDQLAEAAGLSAPAAVLRASAASAVRSSAPSSTALNAEESLAEFRELVSSAGGVIAAEIMQRRPRPDPATLVGAGKVEEIAGVAASTEADLVIFDHDLSPTQLRNLEAALPCRVLDRTQLILDIFARHARTSEGKLQVELAQLQYMLPRLTGRGKAMSQLGGGIGTRGPGET